MSDLPEDLAEALDAFDREIVRNENGARDVLVEAGVLVPIAEEKEGREMRAEGSTGGAERAAATSPTPGDSDAPEPLSVESARSGPAEAGTSRPARSRDTLPMDEHVGIQNRLQLLGSAALSMFEDEDLDLFIESCRRSETLAPLLDPTAWLKGRDTLLKVLHHAEALRAFRTALREER